MQLQHTETRQMLGDSLQRFLSDRYGADQRARSGTAPGHDLATWRQLVELGALGALFGDEDGGFGGSPFDIMVVFEALGRGLVLEPMLDALMSGRALALGGHAATPAVVAGDLRVAFAHQEHGARYTLPHVDTRAMPSGAGFILDGAKSVVLAAEAASHALVSARLQGDVAEPDGIALFLVPLDAPGVTLRPYALIDGGRAAELRLDGVRVDAAALVAPAEAGFEILEKVTGLGLLALSAEGLGLMESLRLATADYLGTRTQFGAPIGSNQALQHRMVDLMIDIEQTRSAVINAAAAAEAGTGDAARSLSAAKYTVGASGTHVAEEAIQMHGGIGMTQALLAAQTAKRLVMIDHQLGDADHHLARYMSLNIEPATES